MHHHLAVNIPQNIISLCPALSGSLFSGGRTLRGAGAAVVLLACGVLTPVSARAATYTVISTNNSGEGTLRWAVAQANANPGADTIDFNIPGTGIHTIHITSPITILSGGLTIDGTTQPGYAGTPLIEINGNGTTDEGLALNNAPNCEFRGLCFTNFEHYGIYIYNGDSCRIKGCYFGVDPTGTTPAFIGYAGVYLGSRYNMVGGTGAGEGNLFGINADGTTTFTLVMGINASDVGLPSVSTLIGGTEPGAGNVITNASTGIVASIMNCEIQGNRIGITSDGTPAGNGVGIQVGARTATIGGTDAGAGNIIAHNTTGIVLSNTGYARASRILGNRIFANSGMAIDVHGNGPTPNDNPDSDGITNYPVLGTPDVISVPNQVTIPTTLQALPSTSYIVEYFRHAPSNTDAEFLGRVTETTDESGLASFDAVFPTSLPAPGWYVTATATPSTLGATGTSELSAWVPLPVSLSRFEAE